MTFPARTDTVPIREDADGALRVGDSRVLLEMVIWAFQDGATPETIVQQYSTLALGDVYAVIAYFMHHRNEVDAYIAQRKQTAAEVRQRIEGRQGDLSAIRGRLLARRQNPG